MAATSKRGMRATTVRFGTDLWEMLEREAERTGVSVAQYVREAALARVAYRAAVRGEPLYGSSADGRTADPRQARMQDMIESSEAVRRQGDQARRHSEKLLDGRPSGKKRSSP
jgi:hypothetical protein